ncbi:MAG: hypothetical protein HC822_28250 [Oscillochloris sp.]|nr:hypothetical protein [Oscillochloris sp.]
MRLSFFVVLTAAMIALTCTPPVIAQSGCATSPATAQLRPAPVLAADSALGLVFAASSGGAFQAVAANNGGYVYGGAPSAASAHACRSPIWPAISP